jgi:hypothetical protein
MSSLVSGRSLAGAVGRRVVLAVAIAVSVVVIGGWTGRTGGHPAEVTVLRGTVNTVNLTGTAIAFRGKRVGGPRLRLVDVDGGWTVAGATWFDGRAWHDHETPTCLQGGLPQPVELGVVEAAASDDAPGRAVVVWLKCLRNP